MSARKTEARRFSQLVTDNIADILSLITYFFSFCHCQHNCKKYVSWFRPSGLTGRKKPKKAAKRRASEREEARLIQTDGSVASGRERKANSSRGNERKSAASLIRH